MFINRNNLFKSKFKSFLRTKNCLSFKSKFTVLGIETSCDDTAIAIVDSDSNILAQSKYNQWSIHKVIENYNIYYFSFYF